jgi:histidine decarboxylase
MKPPCGAERASDVVPKFFRIGDERGEGHAEQQTRADDARAQEKVDHPDAPYDAAVVWSPPATKTPRPGVARHARLRYNTARKERRMSFERPSPLAPADADRLDLLYEVCERESERFLGYPVNTEFDYAPLFRFLRFSLNNVGDPYVGANYRLNTHDFEREVLARFFSLTDGPAESTWGYCTNGGTEGNMYGLFLARELHPEGLVYYSEDSHYSVNKILRCLHLRNIMIKSRPDGAIDLDDLRETIRIHRDAPPIVFANVGTTMKGACDDLAGINAVFDDLAIRRKYVHADAALSGMILPFVVDPPAWNFSAGVDSISISGHKMIGAPMPCGVALARKAHVDRIARSVEYVSSLDTTLSGSRNAIAPLLLWYAFKTVGLDGFRDRVQECFRIAEDAVDRLNDLGWNAWRHRFSNTVVFDRPPTEIVRKWQLAVEENIAHLLVMPQVDRRRLDGFLSDLEQVPKEAER